MTVKILTIDIYKISEKLVLIVTLLTQFIVGNLPVHLTCLWAAQNPKTLFNSS